MGVGESGSESLLPDSGRSEEADVPPTVGLRGARELPKVRSFAGGGRISSSGCALRS